MLNSVLLIIYYTRVCQILRVGISFPISVYNVMRAEKCTVSNDMTRVWSHIDYWPGHRFVRLSELQLVHA